MSTIFTKIFHRIKKTPKIWSVVLIVLVAVLVIWPLVAAAADTTANGSKGDSISRFVAQVIGSICFFLIQNILSSLILVMVNILIWISSYNDFANSLAVVNGWVVVRDIANMFFIVILLVIAFGTILGQEEYSYKRLLPKLVVMALLINFSRTIAGLMIDAAQVVMITFVNGYSAAAGGNFINALRLTEIMKFNDHYFTAATMDEYHIAAAALFGVIILIMVNIVITVIVAVLAMRIVMLWLLIVLAPIAWLLGTFPQGQKYYSQWWDEFRNQVVVGPALAFFLWLSLATVGSGRAFDQVSGGRDAPVSDAGNSVVITQVGAMDSIISLIISLGMLLAGMKVAQDMGGAIAGVMSKAKSAAIKGMALPLKAGFGAAGFAASWGERKVYAKTGVGLNPMRVVEKFKAYAARRKMIEEATGAAKAGAGAEEWASRGGAGWGLAAIGRKAMGAHADFFEDYMGLRGVKRFGGVLAGGPKEAKEIRKKAKNLKDDRLLIRTKDEQDIKKRELSGLETSLKDKGRLLGDKNYEESLLRDTGRRGTVDLSVKENQDLAREQIIESRQAAGELRKKGKIDEANELEVDTLMLEEAVKNQDKNFTFRGLSFGADLVKKFTVPADALKVEIGNIKSEIDKLNDKKIKLTAEIKSADDKKLVFADDDIKKVKVEEYSQKINNMERAAAFRTPPRAFYAAENFRAIEAEEGKKMPHHALEATEVVEQFQNALQEKNKVKAMAWLKKATEDYNDNEIFNGLGYDGGFEGIEKFRKEVLMKQLGMKEQESIAHMSDINYINEEKGHINATRMYTVENGLYKVRTHEEQAAAIANENLKKDPRKFAQNTNRLGYGYETPDGKYRIDKSGLATIVGMQGVFIDRIGKGEMNLSAMNKMAEALDQLVALERKGLLTARDPKSGLNLREILQGYREKGPLEEGASMKNLESLVGKVKNI